MHHLSCVPSEAELKKATLDKLKAMADDDGKGIDDDDLEDEESEEPHPPNVTWMAVYIIILCQRHSMCGTPTHCKL